MQWIERTLGAGFWGVAIVAGPIILAVMLAWAALSNRRRSKAERDLTERAVHDRREESRARENIGPR